MKHRNVIEAIRAEADRFQDLPAVIDGPWRCTHAQLYDRVDRVSNALLERGFRKGDRLLCWLPNVHEALEVELACLQIGGVWVTLNAALTGPEVAAVLESTKPRVIVTMPSLLDRLFDAASGVAAYTSGATLIIVDGSPNSAHTAPFADAAEYETLIVEASPERPQVEVGPDDLARLRYTSGTTGSVKAAMLSHRAYLASLETLQDELPPLTPDDRVLHAAPLTHASAAYLYPVLAAGGANVLLPKFDAQAVLRTIETERITIMFAVPTILHRLADAPGFAHADLSSLRSVSYGGAPTPPDVLRPVMKRIGPALLHIYGLTEALHPVTTLHREEHRPGNPKLGSIGKPTKRCNLRVVDEDGRDVPVGEIGELCVKGPIAMDGYWRDPDATVSVMRDGWIATGDLGYCDKDGYYWIVDRKKDVIITGGFNVYSSEVEAVLAAHPAVAEAAVIGVPHADWGEAVHAVVTARDGEATNEDELIAYCRARLAPYKAPKSITVLNEPLPRNSSGKMLKQAVAAKVAAEVASK